MFKNFRKKPQLNKAESLDQVVSHLIELLEDDKSLAIKVTVEQRIKIHELLRIAKVRQEILDDFEAVVANSVANAMYNTLVNRYGLKHSWPRSERHVQAYLELKAMLERYGKQYLPVNNV